MKENEDSDIEPEPETKVKYISKEIPDYTFEVGDKSFGIKYYNLGHGDFCWAEINDEEVFTTKEEVEQYLTKKYGV